MVACMPEDNGEKKLMRVAEREKHILQFWREHRIFEKSEEGAVSGFWGNLRKKLGWRKRFVFYDGPPFATGLPHYGHILQSALKDAVLRYKTMQGYRMTRRWGWDCHGLPLEVEVEKEIGTKMKKDIEEYGIARFNNRAREVMLRYADEWKKIIPRIGRWVDMENDYRTVNTSYTESVWSMFHRLHTRGLVSEGFKSLHLCPRCSTTISNHEVAENYETLTDTAVYVLLPMREDRNTLFVAWTTTPWTLFGNVALAVHEDLTYSVIERDGKQYILHENAAGLLPGGRVIGTKKGKTFIGREYLPPFEYLYANATTEERSRLWRVHHASYVDQSTGTGIVHLAPAYGAEDLELAQRYGLPIRHHVSKDGVFVEQLGEFAGLRPKEAGNSKGVDEKIIAALRQRGILLKDETVEHSYPVCWRCATPLLNYATNSWFVHTEKYRDRMVAENKKVRWVPSHLRDGRFGNWLENAREWAVSRSRFWGAPLPVWKTEKTGEYIIVDSIETMLKRMRLNNRYIFVRHGESESNARAVFSCGRKDGGLTETGRRQAEKTAGTLKDSGANVIFCSPIARTKETAERIAKATGVTVVEEPLLTEIQVPGTDNEPMEVFFETVRKSGAAVNTGVKIGDGESYRDVYLRLLKFLEKTEKEYTNAAIIVVTHRVVIRCALSVAPTVSVFDRNFFRNDRMILNASVRSVPYCHLARRPDGDVDLHRPYIDDVVLYDDEGNPAYHCGEVFDCWFESGSMPYGAWHYPFEHNDVCDPERGRGFPADCICEAMDQTRGWFYSLMAIGVGAFGRTPYRHVIATGLIRASDGKKMSKKLKNYTDPMGIVERYGADALRHYLLGSPVVRGQDIDFQDGQIDEVYKKVYVRLQNCFHFYETYAHLPHKKGSSHLLDRYIISRLGEMHREMTAGFEAYHTDDAVAPVMAFVEDLSAWYVRRSRDRIRYDTEDGAYARETLRYALTECVTCIAPIAPFCAEYLFMGLRKYHPKRVFLPESVHLCRWMKRLPVEKSVLQRMHTVRNIVSEAHEQRSRAGIKVRQPLGRVTVRDSVDDAMKEILMAEINVKEVVTESAADRSVLLDTALTPELQAEGFVRECIRNLQNMRKEAGLSLTETLQAVHIQAPEQEREYLIRFEDRIMREVRAETIVYPEKKPEGARVVTVEGTDMAVVLVEQAGKVFT